ncbi:MAG: AAA family ATPase [Chloroflexi bacterium]|nr:AAA family ATPase [Chloroflexota bacterium]
MPEEDLGLVNAEPFPFLAIVGQHEMKLALILSVINPRVGGVLLIGPRGTAKTTAVRALADLLPQVERSLCGYGCTDRMAEEGGMDAICPDCAKSRVRPTALCAGSGAHHGTAFKCPPGRCSGGINERVALEQQRVLLERGILGHADGHILYIDEVNLLDGVLAAAILDAAAQGRYTVRRGPLKLSYRARFLLIGSMNPEEGQLRPQLMDRFGLRAVVRGLEEPAERYQAYEMAQPTGVTRTRCRRRMRKAHWPWPPRFRQRQPSARGDYRR